MILLIGSTSEIKAQEVQVPIDEEGKIKVIDRELERELNLFPEYENFQKAWIFKVSDTLYALEVFYQSKGELLKSRFILSKEKFNNFFHKVTQRKKGLLPRMVLNQEGRVELLVGTTVLSLGYYGWAVPMICDVEDSKELVALYMLTGGSGFFIPFWMTENIPVSYAESRLSVYGGTRGILHGILFSNLFYGKGVEERRAVAAGMVGSLLEGTTVLADFSDESRPSALIKLLGSAGGLFFGKILSNTQEYTKGDAGVLRATGLLGAYTPLAIVDALEVDNDKIYTAASMVGSLIGLGLGNNIVKGKDFTTAQGSLVTLSSFAGGLFGAGLGYVASGSISGVRLSTLLFTSSAFGAAGSFWLSYKTLKKTAKIPEESSSWNINLRPMNLIALAMGKRKNSAKTFPILEVNYPF
ncbi:MAG: hypothetical protein U9N06_03865 [candidate division WOR-3 bacterium]|nr:hypothetical protein [candidate division WOR-3 bacterium]